MTRLQFWPDTTTHLRPTEVVDDGEDGTRAVPLRWPWAVSTALCLFAAQRRLPFIRRVELDALKPLEIVCCVPKRSEDLAADVAAVHAEVAKVLDLGDLDPFATLARLVEGAEDARRSLDRDRAYSIPEAVERLDEILEGAARLRAYLASLPTSHP